MDGRVVATPKRGTIEEAKAPCITSVPKSIAGHSASWVESDLGACRVGIYAVDDLAHLVDRAAVLSGAVEPPYWAYLWAGARVLASYLAGAIDVRGRRVLEIGCGLGLPGMTAAVLGGDVTLVDAAPDALAFATESATANGVSCTTVVADFLALDPAWRFDVVLGAEIAYDRERWRDLAAVCERHLHPDGVTILADGYRTDTRGLYAALAARRLTVHAIDVRVVEEGRPVPVRLATIRRPAAGIRPRDTPRPPA